MSTKTMTAIIYKEYGTPEVLQLATIKKPSHQKNKLQVRLMQDK